RLPRIIEHRKYRLNIIFSFYSKQQNYLLWQLSLIRNAKKDMSLMKNTAHFIPIIQILFLNLTYRDMCLIPILLAKKLQVFLKRKFMVSTIVPSYRPNSMNLLTFHFQKRRKVNLNIMNFQFIMLQAISYGWI